MPLPQLRLGCGKIFFSWGVPFCYRECSCCILQWYSFPSSTRDRRGLFQIIKVRTWWASWRCIILKVWLTCLIFWFEGLSYCHANQYSTFKIHQNHYIIMQSFLSSFASAVPDQHILTTPMDAPPSLDFKVTVWHETSVLC